MIKCSTIDIKGIFKYREDNIDNRAGRLNSPTVARSRPRAACTLTINIFHFMRSITGISIIIGSIHSCFCQCHLICHSQWEIGLNLWYQGKIVHCNHGTYWVRTICDKENTTIPHICHFFSTEAIFGSIFLHTKVRKSRQNRFSDKSA